MDSLISHLFSQQIGLHNISWMLFIFAFLGGVITSVSPCSIGLLPVVVGYVGGYSGERNRKSVLQIFFFILGLSLALTTLGVVSAMTGQVLGSQSGPMWTLVMASFIVIMGLNLMEIIHIPMPVFMKQLPQKNANSSILFPIIIGAAFAFATTPCSTPILAGIMAYASLKANIATGALLLFLFSLGQGLILVIAGLFTTVFKKIVKVNSISGYFVKFSGLILLIAGIFLYLKVFDIF